VNSLWHNLRGRWWALAVLSLPISTWTFRRQLRLSPERRIMKKLNKVAVLFASAALAAPLSALAQATSVDNYRNGDGSLSWKNGSGEQCWRNSNWTPATALESCDGAIKPPP